MDRDVPPSDSETTTPVAPLITGPVIRTPRPARSADTRPAARAPPRRAAPGARVRPSPADPDPGARRRVGLLRDRPLGAHHDVEMSVAQHADHSAALSGGPTRPAVTQD